MDYTDIDITSAKDLQNVITDILDGCHNTSDTIDITDEMLALRDRILALQAVTPKRFGGDNN